MHNHENARIQTVIDWFDASNRRDTAAVMSLLTDDIQEFMLDPAHTPVIGAAHVANYWSKVARLYDANWTVERAIATGDEVATEWSMQWTPVGSEKRLIVHGAEWYTFRGELICDIRGYYHHDDKRDTGLTGFPYAERGYTTIQREKLHGDETAALQRG